MSIELRKDNDMELMARYPTRYFDLALEDPQWGIGVGKMAFLKEVNKTVTQKNGSKVRTRKKAMEQKDWDNTPPPQAYFDEISRVSKHQIIWGIDYMPWTGIGTGRIVWDKCVAEGVSFKGTETAFCSMHADTRIIKLLHSGMMQAKSLNEPTVQQGNKRLNELRRHPCQKPVLLYKRLILDYAKPGYKILDTHAGSFNIAIAVSQINQEMGWDLELVASDIDPQYYEEGREALRIFNSQLKLI